MGITHFPFNLSTGNKGSDTVDSYCVNSTTSYQCFGYFKRLLSRIWLGNK